MAIEEDWDHAFRKDKTGSNATADRAWRTWTSIRKFGSEKKWNLAPGTITPKQMRLYLEQRATQVTARSVQNEASHIRRAIKGADRDLGNVRDAKAPWSSTRMGVPRGSRVGGKAAASPIKWQEAKPHMPGDVLAAVNLVEALGFRKKEAVMSGQSLREWSRELSKPESSERGCYLHVIHGTKGNRPRFQYVPVKDVEAAQKAVSTALAVGAPRKGHVIEAEDLKSAMSRYSNCLSRLGLTGDDSGHGLRRAFAQRQVAYYRDTGLSEKESLRRLSNDLGHGDGRGRWVWNNYLLGGEGGD